MGVEPILMDVNQDGKTDLLIQYSNTVNGGASDGTMILLLNIGNKFVNVLQSTQKIQDLYLNVQGKFDSGLNKNVLVEHNLNLSTTVSPHYYTFSRGIKFNKILKVKNAYENEYVINYKSAKSPFNGNTSITESANILTSLPAEFEVTSQITGPLFNQGIYIQYSIDP